jgi:hypothetical protein
VRVDNSLQAFLRDNFSGWDYLQWPTQSGYAHQ